MFIELMKDGLKILFRVSEIAAVTEGEGSYSKSPETTIMLNSGHCWPVQESYKQVIAMMDKEAGK